jgi:hypothetical protein
MKCGVGAAANWKPNSIADQPKLPAAAEFAPIAK